MQASWDHDLLPPDAIKALQLAANVPQDKNPNARAMAIDQAIDELRRIYPDRFLPD